MRLLQFRPRQPRPMYFADCFSVCFQALSEISIEDRLIIVKALFDKTRLDYERMLPLTEQDMDEVQDGYDKIFTNHHNTEKGG